MSTSFVRITIVEALTSGKSIIKCAYCDGKGKETYPEGKLNEYHYTNKKCPVCGPRGLLVIEHDDILIECAYCNGTGHQPSVGGYKYEKKCPRCNGSGALSLTGKARIITNPDSY